MTYYITDPAGINPARVIAMPDATPVPPGTLPSTLAAYNAWIAAQEALVLTYESDACLARKAVYDDLKASAHTVDWSEATFRFLSGYSPGDC